MALGANLYVDVFLGRTSYELVTTVANYFCLIIGWMDSFSHFFHLSEFFIAISDRFLVASRLKTALYKALHPQARYSII